MPRHRHNGRFSKGAFREPARRPVFGGSSRAKEKDSFLPLPYGGPKIPLFLCETARLIFQADTGRREFPGLRQARLPLFSRNQGKGEGLRVGFAAFPPAPLSLTQLVLSRPFLPIAEAAAECAKGFLTPV